MRRRRTRLTRPPFSPPEPPILSGQFKDKKLSELSDEELALFSCRDARCQIRPCTPSLPGWGLPPSCPDRSQYWFAKYEHVRNQFQCQSDQGGNDFLNPRRDDGLSNYLHRQRRFSSRHDSRMGDRQQQRQCSHKHITQHNSDGHKRGHRRERPRRDGDSIRNGLHKLWCYSHAVQPAHQGEGFVVSKFSVGDYTSRCSNLASAAMAFVTARHAIMLPCRLPSLSSKFNPSSKNT
jgi:hypothetical protein